MEPTILAQAAAAPVGGALPGIMGVATFAYLVWQAIIQKQKTVQERLQGLRALVPLAVLVALSLIPAATLTLFGPAQAIMSVILELSIMASIGYVLALTVYQAVVHFDPSYAA